MLMPVSASSFDDAMAAERGRLLAAQAMANNPEQKKTVEAVYGVEYCKRRYPEAYQSHAPERHREAVRPDENLPDAVIPLDS